MKGKCMKKGKDSMRKEYSSSDFKKLERGKFHKEVAKGTVVALIPPDIAKSFPSSDAVNNALKGLLDITEEAERLTNRSKTAKKKTKVG